MIDDKNFAEYAAAYSNLIEVGIVINSVEVQPIIHARAVGWLINVEASLVVGNDPIVRLARISVLHHVVDCVPLPNDAARCHVDFKNRLRPHEWTGYSGVASGGNYVNIKNFLPCNHKDIAVRHYGNIVM